MKTIFRILLAISLLGNIVLVKYNLDLQDYSLSLLQRLWNCEITLANTLDNYLDCKRKLEKK